MPDLCGCVLCSLWGWEVLWGAFVAHVLKSGGMGRSKAKIQQGKEENSDEISEIPNLRRNKTAIERQLEMLSLHVISCINEHAKPHKADYMQSALASYQQRIPHSSIFLRLSS